jgi:drug/metabolite transporter (DMT)-like permease
MSVVFPMLFSIMYYHEKIYLLKIAGIILAMLSIILASIKEKEGKIILKDFIYPFSLFIGMGLIDSLIKFNQEENLKHTGAIESSTLIFIVSGLIGILVMSLRKKKSMNQLKTKTLLYGTALGLANFGSLYFLILALNVNFIDSSIIFAINNLSIIIVSALTGSLIFSEKLSKLNWLGVLISLIAIASLSIKF